MTLTELINSEPANAARTDQEVLDWLQESVAVVGSIGSRVLLRWGAANARLDALEQAATNHASASVRSLARAAVLTVSRPDTELDMGDANHVALVDALVAAEVLTPTDKTELTAMATVSVERWAQDPGVSQQHPFGPGLVHVANARAV